MGGLAIAIMGKTEEHFSTLPCNPLFL